MSAVTAVRTPGTVAAELLPADAPTFVRNAWQVLVESVDPATGVTTRPRDYLAERAGIGVRQWSRATAWLRRHGVIAYGGGGHRGSCLAWSLLPLLADPVRRAAVAAQGALRYASSLGHRGAIARQARRDQRTLRRLRRAAGERLTPMTTQRDGQAFRGGWTDLRPTLYGGHDRLEDARAAQQRDLAHWIRTHPTLDDA